MPENTKLEIKGMTESSFLDWDGKIVTTLYLPNCNLRCPFCHNWELIETPEKFDTIPLLEVKRYLRTNHDFLDGVCITGGEPTIYSDLTKLIENIKGLGLKVKLDTNGTQPKVLNELIDEELIDYIAMDVKAPLDGRYNKLVGINTDIKAIKDSIQLIMASPVEYEFRTTVVPTLHAKEDILELSRSLEGAKKFAIQQFVPKNARAKVLRNVKPFELETMKYILDHAQKYIKEVFLRGVK